MLYILSILITKICAKLYSNNISYSILLFFQINLFEPYIRPKQLLSLQVRVDFEVVATKT